MLRIAVPARYFPSSAEPWAGRSAYQSLRVLAREAEVRVFYPNATYPALLKPRSRLFNKLDPSYCPPDVKVNYYDFPALPLISRPFNGRMAARTLLPHVREFAPDIIFSFYLYPYGYAALQIGKALAVPVVIESIGSDVNGIADPFSAIHTRTVLREADFLVTVSEDLRRKIIAMGAPPEKTRTVINGCDLSVFHVRNRFEARRSLGLDPDSQAVIYIGRLDVKKGLRELVQAAVKLHPQWPRLHTYIVGDGPDKPAIEAAIQGGNAESYVHLAESCGFDDVAVWMAASDLVTLPSYMEGCPNVIVEALACGRPVVATRVGGIPEIMDEDSGCFVRPRRPDELAQAIAVVLNRTWTPEVLSAKWSRAWSVGATELLEIFRYVIASRQSKEQHSGPLRHDARYVP